MKAYYLIALVGVAALGGCAVRSVAYEPLYTPATVAYVSPAYIAPITPPPGTLLPGASAGTLQAP